MLDILSGPIVSTTSAPSVIFGFTLSQALIILFLGIIAIATLISALVATSKYYTVKYAGVEDQEAVQFSREMRNYFRDAVHTHLKENPPWSSDEEFKF